VSSFFISGSVIQWFIPPFSRLFMFYLLSPLPFVVFLSILVSIRAAFARLNQRFASFVPFRALRVHP
jgi:hypothetical protein